MKYFMVFSVLASIADSQRFFGPGSSLGNVQISQVSDGANVRVIGPGSSSINGIVISGNPGNRRQSQSENMINTVHIDGQNFGHSNSPLRINQRSQNDNVQIGPNSVPAPSFERYPQYNNYANRPEYYSRYPQFAFAPAALRPSIQYPGIRNSLNNGNEFFKSIFSGGGGGLSLPYSSFWG